MNKVLLLVSVFMEVFMSLIFLGTAVLFQNIIIFVIFLVVSAIYWIYIITNPILCFYKHKSEVVLNISEFPMQDLGEDLNNFVNTYNEFYSSKNEFKVYFERSINKRNQIIARFESDNGSVKACTLNNLRLIEKYRDVSWYYKCDVQQ